jgi:uroporphyrin-3 C-methyltransferase
VSRRVIVTRPPAQAAGWVAQLRQRGVDAVALPLIGIAPAADAAPLHAAWQALAGTALVVFVSPNAVEHFFAARPAGAAWPETARAGSTGPGTSAALRAAGVPAAQIAEPAADAPSFDSEALWARIAGDDWQGRRVLVVRGEDGRDWLAAELRRRGAEVGFVAAYRRLPPALDAEGRALLQAAQAEPARHLWLFSSSEAIGHLKALAPAADWSAAGAFASHPRIAETARAAGFGRVDLVSPDADAVAAFVQRAQMAADTIEAPVTDPAAPLVSPPATAAPAAAAPAAPAGLPGRWIAAGAALLAAFTAAAFVFAWSTQQRVKAFESELVKRQQEAGAQAAAAKLGAHEAQEVAREAAAKIALLEARVAETSMQRSQLEDLIQSLARSRDENVLADVDAAIRVAVQQSAITGSAEPLLVTLKQADERLARYNQPRLERVRRAVAQDLERAKAAGVTDIAVLTIRLDEAMRAVDELPLLSAVERRGSGRAAAAAASAAGSAPVSERWRLLGDYVWTEVRSLVRVTRIDQPEAMLVAPEQAWFLRENLKLRLLNARLALLSRQFDTAQSDLRDALAALERYFDRSSRRVGTTIELVRQVTGQARLVNVPRPDATLAAIATASAGR